MKVNLYAGDETKTYHFLAVDRQERETEVEVKADRMPQAVERVESSRKDYGWVDSFPYHGKIQGDAE